jgi:sugar/nucleoside kinase (ribokinase family)
VLLPLSDSAGRRAVDSALRLCELFQIQVVVVTCGADGSVLVRGEAVVQQTAFPVDVVDSIGAGDAFLGALIATWMGGAGDARALRSASAAGALAASAAGAHASLPDRMTLSSFLSE